MAPGVGFLLLTHLGPWGQSPPLPRPQQAGFLPSETKAVMETVNTQGSRVITGRKGGWEGERGSLFQRHRGSCPEGLGLRASPLLLHSQRLPDQPSVRASPEASRKKLHREAGLLAEGHMVSKAA